MITSSGRVGIQKGLIIRNESHQGLFDGIFTSIRYATRESRQFLATLIEAFYENEFIIVAALLRLNVGRGLGSGECCEFLN